jgi:hypothetical protein
MVDSSSSSSSRRREVQDVVAGSQSMCGMSVLGLIFGRCDDDDDDG